ncbi:MAG: hypothetical protein ACI4JA_03375 [Oscillospiraceae bacterium]
MLNLIKMDLYRLVRTISFWVMLAVTVAVSVFCVEMANIDMTLMQEESADSSQTAQQETSDEEDVNIGITVETKEEWLDGEIELSDYLYVVMSGGILLIICSIFVAIFVNAEQKTGYIKNIAGQLPFRGLLSVSKLAGVAVQVLAVFVMAVIGTVAAARMCFGDRFVIGDISVLAKMLGVQYVLHFAFSTFVAMLCILSRSAALGMVTGIVINSGIMEFAYQGLNKLVHKIGALKDIDISKYPIESNVYAVTASADADTFVRALITGAVYFAVCVVISMTVTQKRDIK